MHSSGLEDGPALQKHKQGTNRQKQQGILTLCCVSDVYKIVCIKWNSEADI